MILILKKASWLLGLMAFIAVGFTPVLHAKSPQEITKRADQSIGRVLVKGSKGRWSGTGFVIGTVPGSKDLYFVTNHHVADGAVTIVVGFGLEDRVVKYNATVVTKSKGHDMAVLRLQMTEAESYTPPALVLARREIEKGEEVYVIGYPGVSDVSASDPNSPDGYETTLNVGRVSRVTNGTWSRQDTPIEMVQHTAAINKGNSGGPLLDACGRVIGVNTAFIKKGNDTYLSSSSNTLGNFLNDSGIKHTSRSGACGPKTPEAPIIRNNPDPDDVSGNGLPIWALALIAVGVTGVVIAGAVLIVGAGQKSGSKAREKNDGLGSIGGGTGIALRLIVTQPDGGSKSMAITTGMLKSGAVLGRAGSADLAIDGGKISRQHAKIYQEGRKLLIMDLGSTNGTKLNGKPLRPHQATQINTSSVLELGSVKIKLSRK